MILIDKKIKALGEKVLHPFAESQVGSVCYDLTTAAFFDPDGKQRTEIEIAPGDSVFVQCQEVISLPADLAARVILRNRGIRQGLTLAAPLYQPGHHTPVYFRLTNITDSTIGLQQHDGIAALVFEDLGEAVEKPYAGQYQNELTFKGVGGYLSRFVKSAQAKVDDVKNVERSIYANVLTVMAVFVAVFGLFSLNASFISRDTTFTKVFLVNAYTIGVIAFLAAIVKRMISSTTDNCLVIIGCFAFVFALIGSCFILA